MSEEVKMKMGVEPNTRSAEQTGKVLGTTAGKSATEALNKAIEAMSRRSPAVTGLAQNFKLTSSRKSIMDAISKTALTPEQAGIAALDPKLQKWTVASRQYIASIQQQKAENKELNKILREQDSIKAKKNLAKDRSAIRLQEAAAKLELKEQYKQIHNAANATERMGGIMGKVTGIFQRFGRVLTWRLYRMAAMKVIQMLSEGLQELVQWDYEFGNNTSGALATMTEIKSTIDQVKRSLGAMAMPIIQVVMPIFRAFANAIIFVANLINQVVRALQGYSTYMRAVYVETSAVTDETKKATGAAKELQRVLFGFDDLNILPDENGRRGYGGTGALDGIPKYAETEISIPVKFAFTREPGNIVDFFVSPFDEIANIFDATFGKGGLLDNPLKAFDEAWEQFSADMKKSWKTLKENLGLDKAAAWISQAWQDVKRALAEGWQGVKNTPIIGDVIKVLGDIFSGRAFTGEYWSGMWNSFKTDMEKAWGGISTWVKTKVTDPIVNWFRQAVSDVGGFFDALWQSVKLVVDYVIHPSKWGSDLGAELKKIWANAFPKVEEEIKREGDILNYNQRIQLMKLQAQLDGNPLHYRTVIDPATGEVTYVRTVMQKEALKQPPIAYGTKFEIPTNGAKTFNYARGQVEGFGAISMRTQLTNAANTEAARNAAQASVSKLSPITFATSVITSGLGYALSVAWGALQTTLNNNPLVYATSVGTYATTAAVLASKKKNIAMAYASGGVVPNAGQLIQVNEAGPEVVANLGHSTGIMNVNQMQEAVAAGNIDVVNAVYAMANMVVNAVNSKDLDVYMDSAKVGQSVTNYQNNQMRRGVAY